MKKITLSRKLSKGFTLVELLVVIAVIGILAAVILIAINPGEQLARGRDSSRKTTISQLGRAIQSFYTSQNASYPTNTWAAQLLTMQEIKIMPQNNTVGITQCTTNVTNGYCYKPGSSDAVVYSALESQSEANKITCPQASTWFVWSSAEGKAGAFCGGEAGITVGLTGLK